VAAPAAAALPALRRPARRRPGHPPAAHHRYVCTRHRYWIGPPDAGQPATPLGPELADVVAAQWRHLRLLRRYGSAATHDAVLTGFLICGHLCGYQPGEIDDPVAHWMTYDSWRPPSRAHTTFPQTRAYGSPRPATTSRKSLNRTERSGLWFTLHRHGGNVILHHRHIQPVLIRDWSPKMDGITATIWASRTTLPLGRHDRPGATEP
jgi:hypothetical protein